jgi:hypothetical protein
MLRAVENFASWDLGKNVKLVSLPNFENLQDLVPKCD